MSATRPARAAVLIDRAGLLPLPPPSPYWHGDPLTADELPDPVPGQLTGWYRDPVTGGWVGVVAWTDPRGYGRITTVPAEHLEPVDGTAPDATVAP